MKKPEVKTGSCESKSKNKLMVDQSLQSVSGGQRVNPYEPHPLLKGETSSTNLEKSNKNTLQKFDINIHKLSKRSVNIMKNLFIWVFFPTFILVNLNAYEPKDLDKFKQTNQCSYGNLSEADLSGFNISNATLFSANLQNANLSGINIEGSDFSYANLDGADLSKVHIIDTNLSGANLKNVKLDGASISMTDLRGADLTGANLENTHFYKTIMPDGTEYTHAGISDKQLIALPPQKFMMPIEDVFVFGEIVVTGKVEKGAVHVGDELEVVTINGKVIPVKVEKITQGFNKYISEGKKGETIGLSISGITRENINRGCVIAASGTIKPYTNFKCKIFVKTSNEGGRGTAFFDGFRPQFYIWTTAITGRIKFPAGIEMAKPGETLTVDVELTFPIALEKGLPITIIDSGRVVAIGRVIEFQ